MEVFRLITSNPILLRFETVVPKLNIVFCLASVTTGGNLNKVTLFMLGSPLEMQY